MKKTEVYIVYPKPFLWFKIKLFGVLLFNLTVIIVSLMFDVRLIIFLMCSFPLLPLLLYYKFYYSKQSIVLIYTNNYKTNTVSIKNPIRTRTYKMSDIKWGMFNISVRESYSIILFYNNKKIFSFDEGWCNTDNILKLPHTTLKKSDLDHLYKRYGYKFK